MFALDGLFIRNDRLKTPHRWLKHSAILRLAATITEEYDMDVYNDALFLFCGGNKDRFKVLYWEGDGFLLLYKRLENGKLNWPRNQNEVQKLTTQQLRWLLEGLSVNQKVSIKPAVKGSIA